MTGLPNRNVILGAGACFFLAFAGSATTQAKTLEPFSSDQELAAYLEKLKVERPPAPTSGSGDEMEEIAVTGMRASITNNQTAGVDEGGIVKLVGDYLVVLRRGRLFSISIADEKMRPISWINAFGPGLDGSDGWYDEMLVYADRIVVVGYSYEHSGTELNTFRIDTAGALRYEGTWFLRSSDYYSSRNYASRLVGDKLIFYTALPLGSGLDSLPGLRKLPTFSELRTAKKSRKGDEEADDEKTPFQRIASARHVYRPPYPLAPGSWPALHTITTCKLSKPELDCSAVSAIGSYSEVFYVSATAAYIWTSMRAHDAAEAPDDSVLYRLPLDGGAPSALPVAGMPVDQFSFAEDAGRNLNVVVGSDGAGNWMWNAENRQDGSLALLRVPLSKFGDGHQDFDARAYRELPVPVDGGGSFQNRFVGEHLLYGTGDGWGAAAGEKATLFVTRTDGGSVQAVPMSHSIDRLEALGVDAVVVGTNAKDELVFSGTKLNGDAKVVQEHVIPGVEQGELRSHGFFYRQIDGTKGVFGLPVRSAGSGGSAHLHENSLGITYVYNDGREFTGLGALDTEEDTDEEDGCVASCVDWYGNARPIFIDDRVLALLGYELVEAELRGSRLREIRRVTFAPFVAP